MKIFLAAAIIIITSSAMRSYCQNSATADLVSGDFIINAASERYSNMKKIIPQLICSGIFNRSDLVYYPLESLGMESPSGKQANLQYNARFARDADTSLFNALDKKKINYFISGNYSEFNDHFKFSFDLIDVKTKKAIKQYVSEYNPLGDIYKQIDLAAAFLQQAISLNRSSANKLKNVAVLYFDDRLDPAASSLYNVQPDFTAAFAALNLKGGNKFNVLSGDMVYRFSNKHLPVNVLFDTLNADVIITGIIDEKKDGKKNKKLAIEPVIYTRVLQVDTFYLPEQKKSLFFKNDLQSLATKDMQSFLDEAISDYGSWDSSFTHSSAASAAELLSLSNEALAENNLSFASVMAFRITQKKDSAWLGFNQLGNVELKRNNNDEAIDYFERAMPLNKKDWEAYEGKGKALLNKGLYDQALEQFRLCLKQEKRFPGIHLAMARCYFQLGNDSIFTAATLALKNGKDSGEIYNLLGKYYKDIKSENFDSAVYYFQKAYAVNRQLYKADLSTTLLQKGLFLMDDAKYMQALDCFSNSFSADSSFEALDGMRYAYTRLNLYDSVDAVINLGILLKLFYPAEVYSSQAASCISLLDVETNARTRKTCLQKAIYYTGLEGSVIADSLIINKTKARAYFHYGDKDSAMLYYQKILNADPGDWANYLNLAEAMIMNNSVVAAYELLSGGAERFKNKLAPSQTIVSRFLMIAAKMYLNKDYNKEVKEQYAFLEKNAAGKKVDIFDWSFSTFQKWLDSGSIDDELKQKILEQLMLIKKFSNSDIR